jgi:DNA-directed RNA polymerase specialized sigma subunit
MHYSKEKVIELLKQYPAQKRKIELLRYELEHPNQISEDELIESIAIGTREIGGGRSGHISDQTMMIATQYPEIVRRINSETVAQIAHELRTLEIEVERLEHYISLLSERQSDVIRLRDIEGLPWGEIEDALHTNVRTLSGYRNAGIDALTEMYGFIEELTDKSE